MSADLAMTLGTLYSGMGDYAESSRHYRTAIELSAVDDSRYFASIAWYNLSLLERRFYHYRAALQATDESLAAEDLASGHLARGELLESRMDYRGALAEYEAADVQDDTPLAKVSLATLHRRFGRLDLAERYAAEALAEEDPAWLLYYGSDVAHYRLDVHESLADIHEGIARLALGRPTAGLAARCRALLSAAGNALRGWYHRQRARLYAARSDGPTSPEGAEEDGAFHLASATEAYPRIALKYLERARAVETARAPHAEVLYRIDEGTLRRSAGMIREAIGGLDPVWERLPLADALIEIVPLAAREGRPRGPARGGQPPVRGQSRRARPRRPGSAAGAALHGRLDRSRTSCRAAPRGQVRLRARRRDRRRLPVRTDARDAPGTGASASRSPRRTRHVRRPRGSSSRRAALDARAADIVAAVLAECYTVE